MVLFSAVWIVNDIKKIEFSVICTNLVSFEQKTVQKNLNLVSFDH